MPYTQAQLIKLINFLQALKDSGHLIRSGQNSTLWGRWIDEYVEGLTTLLDRAKLKADGLPPNSGKLPFMKTAARISRGFNKRGWPVADGLKNYTRRTFPWLQNSPDFKDLFTFEYRNHVSFYFGKEGGSSSTPVTKSAATFRRQVLKKQVRKKKAPVRRRKKKAKERPNPRGLGLPSTKYGNKPDSYYLAGGVQSDVFHPLFYNKPGGRMGSRLTVARRAVLNKAHKETMARVNAIEKRKKAAARKAKQKKKVIKKDKEKAKTIYGSKTTTARRQRRPANAPFIFRKADKGISFSMLPLEMRSKIMKSRRTQMTAKGNKTPAKYQIERLIMFLETARNVTWRYRGRTSRYAENFQTASTIFMTEMIQKYKELYNESWKMGVQDNESEQRFDLVWGLVSPILTEFPGIKITPIAKFRKFVNTKFGWMTKWTVTRHLLMNNTIQEFYSMNQGKAPPILPKFSGVRGALVGLDVADPRFKRIREARGNIPVFRIPRRAPPKAPMTKDKGKVKVKFGTLKKIKQASAAAGPNVIVPMSGKKIRLPLAKKYPLGTLARDAKGDKVCMMKKVKVKGFQAKQLRKQWVLISSITSD